MRKIILILVAALIAIGISTAAGSAQPSNLEISTAAGTANSPKLEGPNGEHQVVVCKYVGTPGVDERLQTGQNPIVVDYHALLGAGFNGTFPFAFSDAQGRSIAVQWTNDVHFSDLSVCPAPDGPPPPHDECPNIPGDQPEGTDCNPPPPHDECPNIPGDQPEGTDCNPSPPHDECPNIPGDQPEGTDCNPSPPVIEVPSKSGKHKPGQSLPDTL